MHLHTTTRRVTRSSAMSKFNGQDECSVFHNGACPLQVIFKERLQTTSLFRIQVSFQVKSWSWCFNLKYGVQCTLNQYFNILKYDTTGVEYSGYKRWCKKRGWVPGENVLSRRDVWFNVILYRISYGKYREGCNAFLQETEFKEMCESIHWNLLFFVCKYF